MTDEPEQGSGEGRPKIINNVTTWIGGITAVVLALAGLKTAYSQLSSSETAKAPDTEASSGESDAGAPPEPPAVADVTADLPTKYTGTWENKDVTLEYRNGIWVETTAEGTEDEIVTQYEQLSRTDVMTNAIDRNRNLYVRWPSKGGTLEESDDGNTWTRSYEVTAV